MEDYQLNWCKFILQPQYTDNPRTSVKESLQMRFKAVVKKFSCNQPRESKMLWGFFHVYTMQKQVGCFNHRVVTMVADELKKQWLWELYFAQGNPRGSFPVHLNNHNTLTCLAELTVSCNTSAMMLWDIMPAAEGAFGALVNNPSSNTHLWH